MARPTFHDRAFIDHCNLRRIEPAQDGGFGYDDLKIQVERIKLNLRIAEELGVTQYVIFSRLFEHLVNYDVPGEAARPFPTDHHHRHRREILAGALDEVLREASARGIAVIFHTNQFSFAHEVYDAYGDRMRGSARVCPGKEFTWRLFRAQFEEFFDRFPTVAGLQLTTSETQVSITQCDCPDCAGMSEVDRYVKMVEEAWTVCRARRKELQLRTWGNLAGRSEADAYEQMTQAIPEGVYISTKNTSGDFDIMANPTHLIGMGEREQVIEFDAWREYTGWNQMPCYMGDIFAERLRLCRDRGIGRVALRVNWNPGVRPIFDTPWGNWANVYVFMKLAQDVDADPDGFLREYIAGAFPQAARDAAFRFYKASTPAQITWLTLLGDNCNDHSRVFRVFSARDYEERCRKQLADAVGSGYTFPAADIAARHAAIDEQAAGMEALVAEMAPHVPAEWTTDMRRQMGNEVFCAHALTDCLKIFGWMLAMGRGEAGPGEADLSDMRGRFGEADGAWRAFDSEGYEILCGPNRLDMLRELEEKSAAAR